MRGLHDTIVTRAIAGLLASMLLLSMIGYSVYQFGVVREVNRIRSVDLVERVVALVSKVQQASSFETRTLTARSSSSVSFEAAYVTSRPTLSGASDALTAELQRAIYARVSSSTRETISVGYVDEVARSGDHLPRHVIEIAVPLEISGWLVIRSHTFALGAQTHSAALYLFILAGFSLVLVTIAILSWVTKPLVMFAHAAEQFDVDREPAPLSEHGPAEVRAAAVAMNAMRRRISELVRQRTMSFAALSHDLRTLVTRLTMRTEMMEHDDLRDQFRSDLNDITEMVESTLAYLRGRDGGGEQHRPVDLTSVLESVCDDADDAGAQIVFIRSNKVAVLGSPIELKRAVRNLVDNARKYGEAPISVALRSDGANVTIEIADQGLGIPQEMLSMVLEPFVRLDNSRNRETGGAGLGLTIAREIFATHGGRLLLRNLHPRGFVATVTLPSHKPRALHPSTGASQG